MSTIHKTHIALTKELYRAFHVFNKRFSDGKLITPIITLQPSEGKNAYGWFGSKFWIDKRTKKGVSEINLSAEYLARGCNGVLETLLHEMAHLKNAQAGIRDCTSGQYHNKRFKEAAQEFGLTVTRIKGKGYARTDLDDEAKQAIKELDPKEQLFNAFKRKTVAKKTDDKYVTLVVRKQYRDMLDAVMSVTSCNKREWVEAAIEEHARKYLTPGHIPGTVKTEVAHQHI